MQLHGVSRSRCGHKAACLLGGVGAEEGQLGLRDLLHMMRSRKPLDDQLDGAPTAQTSSRIADGRPVGFNGGATGRAPEVPPLHRQAMRGDGADLQDCQLP